MTLIGDSRSMAVGTLLRCRCVEQNQPSSDFPASFMASGARYIPVRAPEFEFGLIMIEAGRTPQAGIVACGAILRFARQRLELPEVDVFVAVRTHS